MFRIPNCIAVWKNENRNLPEGSFEIPKAEMDRYITIFQPPTGDELAQRASHRHARIDGVVNETLITQWLKYAPFFPQRALFC
jgi:hypothetical protein